MAKEKVNITSPRAAADVASAWMEAKGPAKEAGDFVDARADALKAYLAAEHLENIGIVFEHTDGKTYCLKPKSSATRGLDVDAISNEDTLWLMSKGLLSLKITPFEAFKGQPNYERIVKHLIPVGSTTSLVVEEVK